VRVRTISFVAALAVVAIAAQSSAGMQSGPSEMTWIDIGQSGGGPITFTAASPLCPSGTVRDIGGLVGIKMVHTCADAVTRSASVRH